MNRCRTATTRLRHIFLPLHFTTLVVGLSGLAIQANLSSALAQRDAALLSASTPTNQSKQSQSGETVPETPAPTPPLETTPNTIPPDPTPDVPTPTPPQLKHSSNIVK